MNRNDRPKPPTLDTSADRVDPFRDATVISTYTAEQAVADGVLVDARAQTSRASPRSSSIAEVTAQHLGGSGPVFIASGLWQLIRRAVESPQGLNDYPGVWHDVLLMSRPARRRLVSQDGGVESFEVVITGTGRQRHHRLLLALDGQGLTFMLPEDY